MPDPPNIEILRHRHDYHDSLNVQQQMAVKLADIRREAIYWRSNRVTPAIRQALCDKGYDVGSGILNCVTDRDFGYDDCADGTFVSDAGRFIEFSIEMSPDGQQLITIHEFRDITATLDICGTKPGIGATHPFLVLEVLRELNTDKSG